LAAAFLIPADRRAYRLFRGLRTPAAAAATAGRNGISSITLGPGQGHV
jgi:hypothetical protein